VPLGILMMYQVRTCMWMLEYVVYTGFKHLNEHFRVKFIEHFMKRSRSPHKSRHEVNMTPHDSRTEA
jgi:uncharacterized protein YpiB (UPF0302 family)